MRSPHCPAAPRPRDQRVLCLRDCAVVSRWSSQLGRGGAPGLASSRLGLITAVYGEMLPRQPLRFLLADDPGAGKTIMAGLFIKELIIRGDLERCLIVAPGSLVEQWQDELRTSSTSPSIISAEAREKLIVGAAAGVTGIYRHFEAQRMVQSQMLDNATTFRRGSPKIGRNDPCPCGSG